MCFGGTPSRISQIAFRIFLVVLFFAFLCVVVALGSQR